MESYALDIFRAGRIPILGEWLALPLVKPAGSKKIAVQAFIEVFHPIAGRLLETCDAVLRIGGPSAGADEMVKAGQRLGLLTYAAAADIARLSPAE
jgi:GDP-mannose pyrophosphatase NudK